MAEDLDKLLKSEDRNRRANDNSSKKLWESKRRLSGICRSLTVNTKYYDPKITVAKIDAYIAETDKVDRILYSVISGFIVGLDEQTRGIFSTNVDKLLQYVLNNEDTVSIDSKRICIKLYDHFQLNLTQIESASVITKKGIANAMEKEIESAHNEIKGIQKEYITILGIFAAIMLAFVGAFTFSTSVLNNLGSVSVFELATVAVIVGLVFSVLINLLLGFLREINSKGSSEADKKRRSRVPKPSIRSLVVVAIACLMSYGISQMSFPVDFTIFGHHYKVVEDIEIQTESHELFGSGESNLTDQSFSYDQLN